ncbi:Outer membrane receptor proteins, mostly Fe transport [Sphingomonas palmae]|uniref:Outer membrane receptor proteins, mostly Fe transport n=1 Tax=Sphingomonas palmae TaxID=1855283 RepID=A0A1H7J6Z1_9SPHN|nr:TonB-dependent receptor [Sphingomonas palmae]SEK70366.1 Outer membrane receptor proteins, mostly Fe transport [Sphingomonas palmae]
MPVRFEWGRAAASTLALAAVLVAGEGAAQTAPAPAPVTAPKPVDPQGAQPAGQPDRVTGRRTYDAAWFATFAPATALQIVQRVPGFTIESIDPSLRGFGGAAGNVVINGQRPSAKSDTLDTILSRIPAGRVVRVEVGPGDLYGAEFTGKPQVLNLVTSASGGLAGTLTGTLRRDYTGRLFPEGSASALLRSGKSTFNLALNVTNQNSTQEGYDRVTSLPDDQLVEYRYRVNRYREPGGSLSGSWEYNDGTNRTAHLNARAAVDHYALDQSNRVDRVGTPRREDALISRSDLNEYEVGGDVTRPLAGGGIKLIGLATRRKRESDDLSLVDLFASNGPGPTGFSQSVNDREAETLARLVWSRSGWNGWNVEAGAEGVINSLRSRVDLFDLAVGGARTRIDLPVDDATVREVRAEAFVNVGRALSPTLRVDGGLTIEASRLTVSGDVDAKRTLSFLKPKLVLDWRFAPGWRAQLSAQRTVNQLQFTDFISVAELGNDRVNGGNAQLVPQRSWELLGTLEHPILGDGLVRLEAGYTHISLVQDRVPTPEGFDAPGNLGDGTVVIARARIEAPLKTLGVKGGRLTLYGSLVPTFVTDPYTLRTRPFTGNSTFYGSAEFRQDRGSWAWGLLAENATSSTQYRRNETDRSFRGIYTQVFAEWRPTKTSVVTFTLENALAKPAYRDRLFYAPDRTSTTPVSREFRRRDGFIVPALTFKRTFG